MINNILPPVVDASTRVLIVGSMPSVQSLEKQQYYGNARNHFWPLIGEIIGQVIPIEYAARLALLKAHHIGLWDTIQSCDRQGSLDATIRNVTPNNFASLFSEYPQIQAIFFNGSKSFDVFKKHIGLTILAGRAYEKMPSTSPIPGKNIKSFKEKVEAWQVLEKYI